MCWWAAEMKLRRFGGSLETLSLTIDVWERSVENKSPNWRWKQGPQNRLSTLFGTGTQQTQNKTVKHNGISGHHGEALSQQSDQEKGF